MYKATCPHCGHKWEVPPQSPSTIQGAQDDAPPAVVVQCDLCKQWVKVVPKVDKPQAKG